MGEGRPVEDDLMTTDDIINGETFGTSAEKICLNTPGSEFLIHCYRKY
jgi:hypothetical protein